VVREADVSKILGAPKFRYSPPEHEIWSDADQMAFNQEGWETGERLVREGRDRVRDKIINEREAAH
jgi:hypothetical protein